MGAPPVEAGDAADPDTALAADKLAYRIRQALAPLYPDARVKVGPGDLGQVDVVVTVMTAATPDDNGAFISAYVRRLVRTLMEREFRQLKMGPRSHFTMERYQRPELDDMPTRDNPDKRSRPQQADDGLSRRLEGRIRQELGPRFPDLAVRVWFVTPHEIEVDLVVETSSVLTRSNKPVIREYLRRTVLTILANEHGSIWLSARSRFRVVSAKDKGAPTRVRIQKSVSVSAPISTVRSRVIELPTAHVLRPGYRQTEVGILKRTVGSSVFSNVTSVDLTGLDFSYRQGLVRGVEFMVAYRSHTESVATRDPSLFRGGSRGLSVVTGGLKVQFPYRYNGMELSFGITGSLISDLDRPVFLPDEYERFSNAYVVFSTPLAPGFRVHAVGKQSQIPASGQSPSNTVKTLGAAVEWLPMEEVRFLAEVVNETLASDRVGDFGAVLSSNGTASFGGSYTNVGGLFGFRRFGDLLVYCRKLTQNENREYGASLTTTF
ncbi:MAG: hypothetical protein HY815_13295 [Candidatus Riflebacteria bacterium]|nr:hypothetical protein [Candidatus Riflebacteria bacterium]